MKINFSQNLDGRWVDFEVESWEEYQFLLKQLPAEKPRTRDEIVADVIADDEATTSMGRVQAATPAEVETAGKVQWRTPAAEVKPATSEDAVDATRSLCKSKGIAVASALLQEFCAKNATAVPPERRAEYIGKAEALANGK